jgi:hypothetical protein
MMRWVRASTSASEKDTLGCTCDSSGTMVVPAWPPMTGTVTCPPAAPRQHTVRFENFTR